MKRPTYLILGGGTICELALEGHPKCTAAGQPRDLGLAR